MKPWKLSEICEVLGTSCPNTNSIITSISTDTRTISQGALYVALVGERFDGHDYMVEALSKGASYCVCSVLPTGIPKEKILLVRDTKEAYFSLAHAHRRRMHAKVVGITGSVGKTTTKDLIAAALTRDAIVQKTQANLNNEIGVASTLLALDEDTEVLVLEMGMDHMGDLALLSRMAMPDIAVITNIGISHIAELGSRDEILRAKLQILDGMRADAPLILNVDNDKLGAIADMLDRRVITYGFENEQASLKGCSYEEDVAQFTSSFVIVDAENRYPVRVPVLGREIAGNALAAYAVAKELHLSAEKCLAGLLDYVPSGMRQKRTEKAGVLFIEDCYNASTDSMFAGISLLAKLGSVRTGRNILVLGDMLELGEISKKEHEKVGEFLASLPIDAVFLTGKDARFIGEKAVGCGQDQVFFIEDRDMLTKKISHMIRSGDTILFKASNGIHLDQVLEAIYHNL